MLSTGLASGTRTEAPMWTAIKRFFGWIGSLVRRRKFIATQTFTPVTPPPPSDNLVLLFLLLLGDL
jgi:hypothetical protein